MMLEMKASGMTSGPIVWRAAKGGSMRRRGPKPAPEPNLPLTLTLTLVLTLAANPKPSPG